jgi:uncharacterized membrane protein
MVAAVVADQVAALFHMVAQEAVAEDLRQDLQQQFKMVLQILAVAEWVDITTAIPVV